MSVKSEIWVQAFCRLAMTAGLFAALVKRGAAEAGAIFIIVNKLNDQYSLWGPAPGPAYDDRGDRRFIIELDGGDRPAVDALLERRKKSDPDLWIIEVEDRHGDAGLVVARF